jgi:hypothetical protein|tara:strand:+ start:3553 stop:3663 length:111 start_codon:yes stop_codon:yes gene_type:complete
MKEIIKRLKDMISWSDRLGRDEIDELKDIIKQLEEQ